MSGPTTFRKRERERALQDKQQQKAQKRAARKEEKSRVGGRGDGAEDPDIAGIIPGPQPQSDGSAE